jgi:hypothetical protein
MDHEAGEPAIWPHVLYVLALLGALFLAVLVAGGGDLLEVLRP